MADSCCCYVIDSGYLFPTLLSASQARRATSADRTDIKIFCVGERTSETDPFSVACEAKGIDLVFISPATIDNLPIMFARFFLSRLLDAHYGAVVYVDGDTQIAGSLQPLLDVPLAPGRFLAARDPMSVVIDSPNRMWRERRAYFHSIGINEQAVQRYCNSGVLRFNLSDWTLISKMTLAASLSNGHGFKFPDQDALNLMFGTDYLTMSYRWNFPIFFLNCGFQEFISPNIYHFMSNPRPWQGPFQPWGRTWHTPYLDLLQQHPELTRFHQTLGKLKVAKYVIQQRVKRLIESPLWRSPEVRDRVLRSEREAYV